MKTINTRLLLFACLFSVSVITNSCAKADHSTDAPKEQLVLGHWNINRIQLKIYMNGTFIKDTIVNQTPKPENFVAFNSNGGFEYRFNTTTSDIGTYEFVGSDQVVSNSIPTMYSWKMLTLTKDLFTVVSTEPDPAYPGAVVERYQTFVH